MEEAAQSNVLQDWTGALVKNTRGISSIATASTGEIGVMEIQFDNRTAALANEGWAAISEARFNPFQGKGLDATSMCEFDHIAGKPYIAQLRVA